MTLLAKLGCYRVDHASEFNSEAATREVECYRRRPREPGTGWDLERTLSVTRCMPSQNWEATSGSARAPRILNSRSITRIVKDSPISPFYPFRLVASRFGRVQGKFRWFYRPCGTNSSLARNWRSSALDHLRVRLIPISTERIQGFRRRGYSSTGLRQKRTADCGPYESKQRSAKRELFRTLLGWVWRTDLNRD